MSIADLTARLEAAHEGSKALNAAIADIVDGWPVWRETDPEWRVAPNGAPVHLKTVAPPYTTSIDAALTLLPDDFSIGLLWDQDERASQASVGIDALAGFPLAVSAAKSIKRQHAVALALCIAALKARAAVEQARP